MTIRAGKGIITISAYGSTEVTHINKQKFLAELGRLLTFMYEEDRVRALDLYSKIFDDVGNDTATLQLLVPPTRQAVNLARAYDGRDRSLQNYGEDVPAYIEVIEDLRRQASDIAPALPKVDDDQISLFEEPDVAETVFDDLDDIAPTRLEEGRPADAVPEHFDRFPDEDKSDEPIPRAYPLEVPAEEEKKKPERDDFSDAVEAFLKDYTLQDKSNRDELPYPARFTDAPEEPLPAREPLAPQIIDKRDEDRPDPPKRRSAEARPAKQEWSDAKVLLNDLPPLTEKKANIPLLILFILIAVPVSLACIALLLVPALLLLGLAVAAFCSGISGLIAAFTSFSVFFFFFLVFGLSLSLSAIGLLLFWLFLWMLVGVIPGFVRWVCRLAQSLCYKEVVV